jgi:hypothetical protein
VRWRGLGDAICCSTICICTHYTQSHLPHHSAPRKNNQPRELRASKAPFCELSALHREFVMRILRSSFVSGTSFQKQTLREGLTRESSNGDCHKHHGTSSFQDISIRIKWFSLYSTLIQPHRYVKSGDRWREQHARSNTGISRLFIHFAYSFLCLRQVAYRRSG